MRSYHAYQDIWDPQIGEVFPLVREPTTIRKTSALLHAVARRDSIVGHLPFNLAPPVSAFRCNKGLMEVKMNRGAGYDLKLKPPRAGQPPKVSSIWKFDCTTSCIIAYLALPGAPVECSTQEAYSLMENSCRNRFENACTRF